MFHADGYLVRIQPGTVNAFEGGLKTLAEVGPGTWVRYEGVRDDTGMLTASKAVFYPAGTHKVFSAMGPRKAKLTPDYQPVTNDSLLDADGHFMDLHAKVRFSDAGGLCGWHRVPADQALQERVERVGMRVVPEYQKQLPPDTPARISFRFYAVANDKIRSSFACNNGLVLVPKNVVDRLESDDQLAAVLADAVAFNLHRQLVELGPYDWAAIGTTALMVTPPLEPGALIGGEVVNAVVGHEAEVALDQTCARIALQLISDAGYDPWQAPEAWRLLAPKHLSRNLDLLKYPSRSSYQLGILNLQYKKTTTAAQAKVQADVPIVPR